MKPGYEEGKNKSGLENQKKQFVAYLISVLSYMLVSTDRVITAPRDMEKGYTVGKYLSDPSKPAELKREILFLLSLVMQDQAGYKDWYNKVINHLPKQYGSKTLFQYVQKAKNNHLRPYYHNDGGAGIFKGFYMILHMIFPDDEHYKLI
jgi:hypothetical protein